MTSLGRGIVLLAPPPKRPAPFKYAVDDVSRHHRLLAAAQSLRGQIYVRDGAISSDSLTTDGRHIQTYDFFSWHLLTVNENEEVFACMRFCAHGPEVTFFDLAVFDSSAAKAPDLGPKVLAAVRADIDEAVRLGYLYVELGGWAIREELRCTTEAVRMLLMTYSLAKLLGGAYGLSTATTRHHSSSILRRLGGKPLVVDGYTIPPYYDPDYACEMELLRFDSTSPNPRYAAWIKSCEDALIECPVISDGSAETDAGSLLQLDAAVSGPGDRITSSHADSLLKR